MKALILAASVAAISATVPASAQIMTVGGSLAKGCYKAALLRDIGYEALRTCNRAFYEEALPNEDRFATHVNRGIVRMMRREYDGARTDFERAMTMRPNRSEPVFNMGILRFNEGDSAGAIALFSKAIDLGTTKPAAAYYGRGLANEDAGNLRAAYTDLKRAAALEPKWADPARELTRYQVRER